MFCFSNQVKNLNMGRGLYPLVFQWLYLHLLSENKPSPWPCSADRLQRSTKSPYNTALSLHFHWFDWSFQLVFLQTKPTAREEGCSVCHLIQYNPQHDLITQVYRRNKVSKTNDDSIIGTTLSLLEAWSNVSCHCSGSSNTVSCFVSCHRPLV